MQPITIQKTHHRSQLLCLALGTASSDEESPSQIENKPSEGTHNESTQHAINHQQDDELPSSPHLHSALNRIPTSNDPRVLAARTRLWLAIDTALAAYSREIQEIQDGGGVTQLERMN